MDNTNSKYHFLLRPPFIGTHPAGEIARKATDLVETVMTGGFTRPTHGWVEYPEPLTREQVWKYDLLPDDPKERAYYRMWVACLRDDADTEATWAEYASLTEDELKWMDEERYDMYAAIIRDGLSK